MVHGVNMHTSMECVEVSAENTIEAHLHACILKPCEAV